MKDNRKIVLSLMIALAVVVIGIVTICSVLLITSNKKSGQLDGMIAKAEKYFTDNDYSNAVIQFQRVLELDEKNEQAYVGLATCYINLSDLENAYAILLKGFEETNSLQLQDMLAKYFKGESSTDKKEIEQAISINTTLVSSMSNYTCDNYAEKYGNPTTKRVGTQYVLSYGNLAAEFYYYNVSGEEVIDMQAGAPRATAKPVEIHVKDLSIVFPGMKAPLSMDTLEEKGVSSLKCEFNNALKTYAVSFSYLGCRFAIQSTEDGRIESAEAKNLITPINREVEKGKFDLTGYVKSSKTAEGVDGVTLKFRQGSSKTGSVVAQCETKGDGSYFIQLEAGDYTVEALKEGWTEDFFEVHVNDYESATQFDMIINPVQAAGEVSIVLSWGSTPNDVDAHLDGQTSDYREVHVNYMNKIAENGNETIAELDVDDTDSYGPETITLYDLNGSFTYSIVDYNQTGSLGISDATVKVYMDGRMYREYTVPSDASNDWVVFEINDGVISDINSVS